MNSKSIGYITSTKLKSGFFSQKIQNLVIRDYAQRNHISIGLSATEFNLVESSEVLEKTMREYGQILFFSLEQVPKDINLLINYLNSGGKLCFCHEELFYNKDNVNELIELLKVERILNDCWSPNDKV